MKSKELTVGLTFDLKTDYLKMGYSEEEVAEFDGEDTIYGIESTLNDLGFNTVRIGNVWQLVKKVNEGARWDIVFNICEGLQGTGREAQVPALLEAYNIPYVFSGPVPLSLTLHKALTKRVIRDAGLATPDFYVVYEKSDIDRINLPFPLFAKPLAEGTGKGINATSVILDKAGLEKVCLYLLQTFRQPVLVEVFLPGREFTAGITGTGKEAELTGVMEVALDTKAEKEVYSYTNKAEYEQRVKYFKTDGELAERIGKLALDSYRVLECSDAARVDIRLDAAGIPNFIEINPLAGLHPVHSDLPILSRMHGISYKDLLEKIMRSALRRYQLKYPD